MESTRRTIAELVAARWGDHRPGLWFEDRVLSHHEMAAGAAARAALMPPAPSCGVLLEAPWNIPSG